VTVNITDEIVSGFNHKARILNGGDATVYLVSNYLGWLFNEIDAGGGMKSIERFFNLAQKKAGPKPCSKKLFRPYFLD
jgi:hypothetical protein